MRIWRSTIALAALALGAAILTKGCAREPHMLRTSSAAPEAGEELTLTIWNIGYAGLGAESDFFVDLGAQKRPPSREAVDRNLAAIAARLAAETSDLILLQEVAAPSWITWRRDVVGELRAALAPTPVLFVPDFRTTVTPPPWTVAVGSATASRLGETEIRRIPLSTPPDVYYWGVARRDYSVHLARVDGAVKWSVLNVHLSAFDEDGLREKQAREIFALAEAERKEGRCVVVGGDWNMRLTSTNFPHATEERFQFWLRDLPEDLKPEGWRWAYDPRVPTVRTLHQPYQPGVTYRTIVDGFLVAPEMEVLSVETLDLDFENADHNPVRLRVSARCAT